MGFSDIVGLSRQFGAYFAIKRGRHQHLLALNHGGIKDEFAVGCKTGAFINMGIGEGVHLVGGQFQKVQSVLACDSSDVSQPASIRAQCRRNVVIPQEGNSLNRSACCRSSVNLG